MGVVNIVHKGSFKNTEKFLVGAKNLNFKRILKKYGDEGVRALSSATPVRTGITAESWNYRIEDSGSSVSITFYNTNLTKTGTPLVILIQYGHGTRNGGFVRGQDFINPAIQPIFDKLAKEAWREVQKL